MPLLYFDMHFSPGKIPYKYMDHLLRLIPERDRENDVIVGPKSGQDVAVVDIETKYLVMKTDPITFATEDIGYYAVNINANDIATSGANPRWFMATLLLPESETDMALIERIISGIQKQCEKLGISYVGGHTEVTIGLNRPIVVGSMMGTVEKEKLITTMGAKPGDALFLTKGIVLEGAAIIAAEKRNELLEHGYSEERIEYFKSLLYSPGISVVKDAKLIRDKFPIHAMHDPTEGGLANGIVELARNSNCGIEIYKDTIPFIEGTKELCEDFGLDPLGTISSGTLIFAAEPQYADEIEKYMGENGIITKKIGNFTDTPGEYIIIDENGKRQPLRHSDVDEITKIF